MNMNYSHITLLLVIICMVVPVLADEGNTTNTTVVATANVTTVVPTTTAAPAETTTTTVATTTATPVPTTNITTVPTTTTATTIVTTTQTTAVTTGDLSVASSPLGAAILVDGRYYGVTPANVTGIAPGNHMIRLTLSGYNDYEGTVYVVAGQSIPAYGTLHPMSGGPSQIIVATASAQPTTALPETTVQPVTTQATSDNAFSSPTVIAALIGIVTAAIGAGATIFTHNANKVKTEVTEGKEGKEGKDGKE